MHFMSSTSNFISQLIFIMCLLQLAKLALYIRERRKMQLIFNLTSRRTKKREKIIRKIIMDPHTPI